jgi:hypothetical protein
LLWPAKNREPVPVWTAAAHAHLTTSDEAVCGLFLWHGRTHTLPPSPLDLKDGAWRESSGLTHDSRDCEKVMMPPSEII